MNRNTAPFGVFWEASGWAGGKFSHAKTSIEHKRRYAHRFSNPADGKNHSFDDPLELCMAVLHRF
ncbi:hypothetical protein [Aeromonas caviae]|uniref:hypothetical protein n=1 Tax=Aeromonas caviae TaxID=648 RepID=UPI0013E2EEE4|nr:hypothetical protein [Aeromonas caviae]